MTRFVAITMDKHHRRQYRISFGRSNADTENCPKTCKSMVQQAARGNITYKDTMFLLKYSSQVSISIHIFQKATIDIGEQ